MFKYGKKRPQGATRNAPKSATPALDSSAAKSFFPGWLLVGFGIAVGMLCTFMLFLWQPWKPVNKTVAPVTAETPDAPAKASGEPRFDFYTLLPSQKVTTPESAASTNTAIPPSTTVTKTDSSKPAATVSGAATLAQREVKTDKPATKNDTKTVKDQNPKTDKPTKDKQDKDKTKADADKALKDKKQAEEKAKAAKLEAAEKAKTAAKDNVRYTLQAGSFKSNAEADRRRAAIMMSGLPVRVQKVTVKPGQDWYRVVVGPFNGKDKATDARQNLQAEGVDSLMVKVDKK